jgi:hypothetical protein
LKKEQELVWEWADWLGVVLALELALELAMVLDSWLAKVYSLDTDLDQNRVGCNTVGCNTVGCNTVACYMVEEGSNSMALLVVQLVEV